MPYFGVPAGLHVVEAVGRVDAEHHDDHGSVCVAARSQPVVGLLTSRVAQAQTNLRGVPTTTMYIDQLAVGPTCRWVD